ncbi:Ltp family lipoprotein [Nocardioides sp. C4-1]|uniref:Ltp family lipoprotein n=1 Tax=Nocardioides sp. C4-1 TaxID=3151851 RepID=UPI003266CE33
MNDPTGQHGQFQPPPPPGMYTDPDGSGYRRWWDGRQWHPVQQPPAQDPGPGTARKVATWVKAHPKTSGGIAAVVLIAAIAGGSGDTDADPSPEQAADRSETVVQADVEKAGEVVDAEPAPVPVDTDGDGVTDDVDVRPDDPSIQTDDDIDTDKDGVPDHQDAFPKNAEFSRDTDGDGSADSIDDFPKDDRYTTDSDGDGVADSVDDFPQDASRSEITSGMQNAIDSAENYLDFSAFSRSGLIDQLEFEDYSTDDATFAVDYLDVDWNEQAAKSAENYLSFSSFSRQGLIDQLVFEGFTYEQAEYGVSKAY